MLVYSSSFKLTPEGGAQQIIDLIARWMGKKSESFVSAKELIQGVSRKRLKDGSTITSRSTRFDPSQMHYPLIFSTELSHRDDQVSGRLWTTGIGLRQLSKDSPIECTFLLKTDEASTRVLSPIQVTRPRVVLDIVSQCQPIGDTPGLRIKSLDLDSASAFLAEIERKDRGYPIVVISSHRDGSYMVQPERIRSLLVGIADVVQVDPEANTFEIEKKLGKKYGAWGGAINVLYRTKTNNHGKIYCDNSLYRADRLAELKETGVNLDSEILSAVSHQTNVPTSWAHISLRVVDQATLRGQLEIALERARTTDDGNEYIQLLEDAVDQMSAKDTVIEDLQSQVQDQEGRIAELSASVQGLKYALAGQYQAAAAPDDEGLQAIQPLRDAFSKYVDGTPTLEQSLTIIRILFPDRVVVLGSAISSSQESEMFRDKKKAFELLWKLVNNYWTALAEGGGDAEGRKVFGQNAYAQNEASALSKDGKRRRTFDYKGQDITMEKHLKIGIKDSVAETLRIHFEWVAADNVIVIGHCGKHLNF